MGRACGQADEPHDRSGPVSPLWRRPVAARATDRDDCEHSWRHGGFGGAGRRLDGDREKAKTVSPQIDDAPPALLDLDHAVAAHLQAAGDDVQVKTTDFYIAFRRLKNFACVELRNQIGKLLVFVRVNPDAVTLEPGFTRDVRAIGHFGIGDLEKAKPLFDKSYQNG